jgi:hypothetical protein
MPILTYNITSNSSFLSSPSVLQAAVLDWENDIPSEVKDIGGFDAIMFVSSLSTFARSNELVFK